MATSTVPMPSPTILFVPWAKEQVETTGWEEKPGKEYEMKNAKWIADASSKKKNVIEIWYSGKPSDVLSRVVTGQIYIRGHSVREGEGVGKISSGGYYKRDKSGFRYNNMTLSYLDANVAANRLIATGLNKKFTGKLKCYNCWSATGGFFSFAQQFADSMYDKGYRSCTFFGYLGALDSWAGANENKSDAPSSLTGRKTAMLADSRLVRASSAEGRVEIMPSQLKKQ
jgi:hypothetical protein